MKKYQIRFFFEYGGGCLWGADDGYFIDPAELPLSKETLDLIDKLETQFQTSLDWEYPPDPSPWSKQEVLAFKAEAEKLLNKLRAELKEEYEIHNELRLESLINDDINFT